MRILVPGGGGQLALEVERQASALGHDVMAPRRDVLDISDPEMVFRTVSEARPDLVINCAAYNDVDGAESGWGAAFSVNGLGVKNLALACRKNGAVLVHFSSDYVFDGEAGRPYTVSDVPDPVNSYGQSKLLGEEMLREHGERYYIIRTSWVFGKGRHSFPVKLMAWASEKNSLRVVDDQVSSPTYAADLAGAALRLAATGRFGLYHITNKGHTSRYGWARHILRAIRWQGALEPAKSEEFPSPARRPKFTALDNFPIAQVIGCELPPWQDATERFLRVAQ